MVYYQVEEEGGEGEEVERPHHRHRHLRRHLQRVHQACCRRHLIQEYHLRHLQELHQCLLMHLLDQE